MASREKCRDLMDLESIWPRYWHNPNLRSIAPDKNRKTHLQSTGIHSSVEFAISFSVFVFPSQWVQISGGVDCWPHRKVSYMYLDLDRGKCTHFLTPTRGLHKYYFQDMTIRLHVIKICFQDELLIRTKAAVIILLVFWPIILLTIHGMHSIDLLGHACN